MNNYTSEQSLNNSNNSDVIIILFKYVGGGVILIFYRFADFLTGQYVQVVAELWIWGGGLLLLISKLPLKHFSYRLY